MAENKVLINEIIELFVCNTIHKIRTEDEIPRINFLFDEKDFYLFEDIKKHPVKKEGYITNNITKEDIKKVKPEENQNDNYPTVIIKDALLFFDTLTKIINAYVRLYETYGMHISARSLGIHLMQIIWLRMGQYDFNHVEEFLEKQLQFVRNEKFDDNRFESKITEFDRYSVMMRVNLNYTYDETTRNMAFKIIDDESIHELPHVHFEIDDDNICYIYAIQQSNTKERNKKIERKLYKLNKGIENPNVHPNQVYALYLFLNYLKENNITEIKVPKLQVLSYRYHELLSEKVKDEFNHNWNQDTLENLHLLPKWLYNRKIKKYEEDKLWYDHIVEKQDFIYKAKTEGLFNIINRMQYHILGIEIENSENSDYINVKLGNPKQLKKQ